MSTDERLHALDAVRAFALLLGVVHHATLSFVPGVTPGVYSAVVDVSSSTALAIVSFTGHMFRMSLFFMLAGFFTRLVIQRRGLRAFCANRIQRILVPLVLAWIAFFPLVAAAWSRGLNIDPLVSIRTIWPLSIDSFPLSYLWFLYYLLVMYVLALCFRGVILMLDQRGHVRRAADSIVRYVLTYRWVGLLLLTAPLCAGLLTESGWFILEGVITPNRSLVPQLLAMLAYGMAFALGWMLHRNVALLTREVSARSADLRMSVRLGRLDEDKQKGGAEGLMMRLVETPVGASSQMAFGAWAVTSLSSGTDTSAENVMSNSPATNARMRVDRFSITFHSMAST